MKKESNTHKKKNGKIALTHHAVANKLSALPRSPPHTYKKKKKII